MNDVEKFFKRKEAPNKLKLIYGKWMNRYKQPLNKGKLFFFINAWLA